ncbi:MAG: hypothetical protein ACI80I_003452 [Akkermansiaceae bacterium]|jgi:hypothetical protein
MVQTHRKEATKMSLFEPTAVKCPCCDQIVTVSAVGSVNADRRPDYRDAVLNNSFQEFNCDACKETFRLQPMFNYLDVGRAQWIAAMPADGFPNYLEAEDEVAALFATSYGAKSPEAAQVIGRNLKVRLTFGWPAVREKILAREHNIDDIALELMKLDLLRELPSAPLSVGVELRLLDVAEADMIFAWLKTEDEETLEMFGAPLGWYQAIANDLDAWSAVGAKLTDGPFVDMQKIYFGDGRQAAE